MLDVYFSPDFVGMQPITLAKQVSAYGYVPPGHHTIKKTIQEWIAQFHENGFSLEQCAIAARGEKVSYSDILPQITIVQNGYISIVAYQNRGYALLPMD